MNQRLSLVIFAIFFLLLQGCVAVNTFPAVARAGDTITLALGSVDGLDKSRLQMQYVPQSTGLPIDITGNINSVLKIYPDRTSSASLADVETTSLMAYSGHAAWMNIAVVNLPESLPTGPGYFKVIFASSVRVADNYLIQSAEGVHIAAEILPGLGVPNVFSYYTNNPLYPKTSDFNRLEALPHVILRPTQDYYYTHGNNHPNAAEFRIKLPISGNVATLEDRHVHVIWDYKPGEDNKQIQLSWHRENDVITVNVLSPTALWVFEKQFQFSIVIDPAYGNQIDIMGTPQLLSFRYFDINGAEIAPEFIPEVVVMK